MSTADVAIVGGGVMGASAAYHLAARGMRNVVVFDRGTGPGGGSTSRATGGFRAQFSTRINVRLSLRSRAKLQAFKDEMGVDPEFLKAGYLWIAHSDSHLAQLKDALALQRSEGLTEAQDISVDEIRRLNPAVTLDGVVGGTFCGTDGFIRPMKILEGYIGAAERLGVRFQWSAEVGQITPGAEDGWEITTSTERLGARSVVNAAGAWASRLIVGKAPRAPVTPLKRQVAVTVPCSLLPANMPMTIFTANGFHLRVRDGRVLLLWPTASSPAGDFDTTLDDGWLRGVRQKADHYLPILRDVAIDHDASYAGLYEMSPDSHAILGASPDYENYYLITGSSGHGVMHSPALGQLLAEIICDGRATSLDVRDLRPSRFSEGKPNASSELL
jgi:sarcosine oxidase subunit beta